MTNKELKLQNSKYAVVNISDTVGDNTNTIKPLAWFTTAYADKIIEAVDFGVGGGTGGGDVTREQFNNEVQARKDGDATLTANLNKENADRERADTTLQSNIDVEKNARENADTTLTANLNNEIDARTDGDATLTTNLNKEIANRENADTTLQNNIDDEVSARTINIENVNTAITNERDARISADNSINQKLTQETTNIKSNLNKNTYNIASLNSTIEEYWKTIYPVGSIYISTSATFNPNTVWGGKWEQTASGRCLIGANVTYPLGSMGGESTHTLTIDELPRHSHGIYGCDSRDGTNTLQKPYFMYKDQEQNTTYISGIMGTEITGSNNAHNNMQPYLAVYMWKRTA